MADSTPFFSIITPVYNGAGYLPDLIDSVQAQTFTDYEHIIIDDGSTDDGATVAVLERYAQDDPRIRWWSRENKGAYATQQDGLQAATGRYVIIINADDFFADSHVFRQSYDFLVTNPNVQVAYGRTPQLVYSGAMLPRMHPHWRPSNWLIHQICYIQHCSLFVSREYLIAHDLDLDLSYWYAADWDWIIRLFAHSEQVVRLPFSIGCFRMHLNQRSRGGVTAIQDEARRICEQHGGSLWIHNLLNRLLMLRNIPLIGIATLRQKGPREFTRTVVNWLRRRLARA